MAVGPVLGIVWTRGSRGGYGGGKGVEGEMDGCTISLTYIPFLIIPFGASAQKPREKQCTNVNASRC